MEATFRKRRGLERWHVCTTCSHWPRSDYDERTEKPSTRELCQECHAKLLAGNCRPRPKGKAQM